jgi:hypothetical protein
MRSSKQWCVWCRVPVAMLLHVSSRAPAHVRFTGPARAAAQRLLPLGGRELRLSAGTPRGAPWNSPGGQVRAAQGQEPSSSAFR